MGDLLKSESTTQSIKWTDVWCTDGHDSRDSHRTICHQNITDQIFISLFDRESSRDLDTYLGSTIFYYSFQWA